MPVLTNLSSRLRKDPSWRAIYAKNLPKSKTVAREICLVHVSGNPSRVSFADLILTPPYKLPTSESSYGYCSNMTRHAEDVLGLNRSLYFYAGR